MKQTKIRIERRGRVERLTPRVERFLKEALGGISLDAKENSEEMRPDYICLNGMVAVELKTLEEDGAERWDNFVDVLRERDDWPSMLGSAPLQPFLKNMKDGEQLHKKAIERIGRAIVAHIRKANKQLKAHAEKSETGKIITLLFLVNEDNEIYEPEVTAYVIQKTLYMLRDGAHAYPDIDAVIYLTERHATRHGSRLAYPFITVDGIGVSSAPWKGEFLDYLSSAWGDWTGNPMFKSGATINDFTTIEHVPEQMERYRMWELDYRRRPYMEHFSNEQLRDVFDEITLNVFFEYHKGAPYKPSKQTIAGCMQKMSHIRLEMGQRGISLEMFQMEPQRHLAAATRLALPEHAIEWLKKELEQS